MFFNVILKSTRSICINKEDCHPHFPYQGRLREEIKLDQATTDRVLIKNSLLLPSPQVFKNKSKKTKNPPCSLRERQQLMGPSFTFSAILTSLPNIISSSISFSQTLSMNYTVMGKPSVIGCESWLGGQRRRGR